MCFIFDRSKPDTWQASKQMCEDAGSVLVTINNAYDWKVFSSLRAYARLNVDIWLGLRFNVTTANYEWADGEITHVDKLRTVDGFPDWNPPKLTESAVERGELQCVYSNSRDEWVWGDCSIKRVGVCYSAPKPTTTTSTTTTTTTPKPTLPPATPKPARGFTPTILSGAAKTIAAVSQSMGCIFIVSALAAVVVLYIVFRSITTDSLIVFNQDVALLIAHLLVLTLRDPTLYEDGLNEDICKVVAIALHYFFLAGYTFMMLEALQTMMIVGRVMGKGNVFTTPINLLIGWGLPLAIVGGTAPFVGDEYSTTWTCWGDMERSLTWALFVPMAVICALAMIMVEAGGMLSRSNGPREDEDKTQMTSAMISRSSLAFIMGLTVGSHLVGMAAVFFQIVPLYLVTMVLNIANGIVVFIFHTSMDRNIRTFVGKLGSMLCRCC